MLVNGCGYFEPYGTLTPTESNTPAPLVEPLALDVVKNHLRVDFADDDSLIQVLISAARKQAEVLQRRVLVRQQFDLTLDYWTGCSISLASPTISVDLVQVTKDDGSVQVLQAGVDYVADLTKRPGIILPPVNTCWPWFSPQASSSILIRFTAGYAFNDPFWSNGGALLKAGMLLLVSHWYTNRSAAVVGTATELPFAITTCLSNGSLRRPR